VSRFYARRDAFRAAEAMRYQGGQSAREFIDQALGEGYSKPVTRGRWTYLEKPGAREGDTDIYRFGTAVERDYISLAMNRGKLARNYNLGEAEKGGPGSGYYGPDRPGLPGVHGGSRPRGAGGEGGEVVQAGITSARPGKPGEQVEQEMAAFKRDLAGVAKDVDVSMGTGGWEGGEEPTWVTRYRNGPEALAVVARYAKKHNQDAAIIMKGARKGDPGAAPQQRLRFDRPLDEPAMRVVESQLVANGIGGWTWARDKGKTTLVIQTIPEWGGDPEKDISAIRGLREALSGLGVRTSYQTTYTQVTIMERGEYDQYTERPKAKSGRFAHRPTRRTQRGGSE
jgi:hypothetical protein